MAGYPHALKIECAEGSTYATHGVLDGAVQIWLVHGELNFNGDSVSMMGSSFWANAGTRINISISGMAWIVGAPFLLASGSPNVFTASYDAPESRKYDLLDASNGIGNASLSHDEHISNGSSA